MKTKKHKCQEGNICTCSSYALEPNEECPVHGAGLYPKRCDVCGKFLKVERKDYAVIGGS